jgi:3-oxoacyl-[acyl-carrier protein] reductase
VPQESWSGPVRNVIVTGGSRGLGLAMSRALANSGYRVIAVARTLSTELASAARQAADEARGAIEFRACDLSDLNLIAALVRSLRADFGPLYGLVNNAGLGTSGILSSMRDLEIQRLIQLNTVSPIVLSKYVLRSMMSQREGRIINIASIVAATGYSGLSVYSATKASLIGFTRSLAREVGQLGITVNALAPGFIDTEMTHELTDSQREKIGRRSALRRMPEPIDVARSVEFLLGEGGRNITGTVITIDAGNSA